MMKTRNFYVQIYPLPLGRRKKKFKKFSDFYKTRLKNPNKYFRNNNMSKIAFWPIKPSACSVHAVHNRCKACTERAEGCIGQNAILNMFLFLKYFSGFFKPSLVKIWELFWKEYFFLPRVPPFGRRCIHFLKYHIINQSSSVCTPSPNSLV